MTAITPCHRCGVDTFTKDGHVYNGSDRRPHTCRYRYMTDSHGDIDYSKSICADCSTRTTPVMVYAADMIDHDATVHNWR